MKTSHAAQFSCEDLGFGYEWQRHFPLLLSRTSNGTEHNVTQHAGYDSIGQASNGLP